MENIKLYNIDLEQDAVEASVGFHSSTGNDYVSSFFTRGKEKSWQISEKRRSFQNALSLLGEEWTISHELLSTLEEYVCQLYRFRDKKC